MRRFTSAVGSAVALAAGLALAAPVPAQEAPAQEAADAPQTLVVSQFKCDVAHVGDIMAAMDSVARPVWQEIVDEGLLESVGTFSHEWGDEWNFNIYYVAADKETFFSAHDELNRRVAEAAPEDEEDPVAKYCTEHRDNIYRFGPVTEGAS